MVHAIATLGFLLAAMAGAGVIWFMLDEYRDAIRAALTMSTVTPVAPVRARRVRVRSVRPTSVLLPAQRRAA